MTYDDFLMLPASYINDMINLMKTKNKYNMRYSSEEKIIFKHLETYYNEMKVNQFRHQLEKCWRLKI